MAGLFGISRGGGPTGLFGRTRGIGDEEQRRLAELAMLASELGGGLQSQDLSGASPRETYAENLMPTAQLPVPHRAPLPGAGGLPFEPPSNGSPFPPGLAGDLQVLGLPGAAGDSLGRPPIGGVRAEAEGYADQIAQRGTPQWGSAVRDFVMQGPSSDTAQVAPRWSSVGLPRLPGAAMVEKEQQLAGNGGRGIEPGSGLELQRFAESEVSAPAASPLSEARQVPEPLARRLDSDPRPDVRNHANPDANEGEVWENILDDQLAQSGEVPRRLTDIADRLHAGGFDEAPDPRAGRVQFARAEVRGDRIFVRPEDWKGSDVPDIDLPRIPGTKGFSPSHVNFHHYRVPVVAPPGLSGRKGLLAVQQELMRNPTTGQDREATRKSVVNDVGDMRWFDNDTNYVKTYRVPSKDPDRSDAVINYTIPGAHMANEGFVIRFARLRRDGRVEIVTYGEGNAVEMHPLASRRWKPLVKDAWTRNSQDVISRAMKVR